MNLPTAALDKAMIAALATLALHSAPVAAGPRTLDPAAAHADKVRKLKEGPPSSFNDAFYTTWARQHAANSAANSANRALPNGATRDDDGTTNVNSVVLQPGARVSGPIVIVTQMRDLTVVNQRSPGQ